MIHIWRRVQNVKHIHLLWVATRSRQTGLLQWCPCVFTAECVWMSNIYTWHLSYVLFRRNRCKEICQKTTEHEEICTRTLQIPTLSMGRLNTRYCYTECSKSTWSYSLSSLQNTYQIQKQQRYHIHINNSPSLPQESLQHFRLHSCLKMRTEDQLHCVSLTTPFRGMITVLEVVTPDVCPKKKKKEKKSLCAQSCTGLGTLEVHGFF